MGHLYRSSNSADKCCVWSNFGPEFAQPRSSTITRIQCELSIKSARSGKNNCQLAAAWLLLAVASWHLYSKYIKLIETSSDHVNARIQPLRVAKLLAAS